MANKLEKWSVEMRKIQSVIEKYKKFEKLVFWERKNHFCRLKYLNCHAIFDWMATKKNIAEGKKEIKKSFVELILILIKNCQFSHFAQIDFELWTCYNVVEKLNYVKRNLILKLMKVRMEIVQFQVNKFEVIVDEFFSQSRASSTMWESDMPALMMLNKTNKLNYLDCTHHTLAREYGKLSLSGWEM